MPVAIKQKPLQLSGPSQGQRRDQSPVTGPLGDGDGDLFIGFSTASTSAALFRSFLCAMVVSHRR
jgi:hypothetical protein